MHYPMHFFSITTVERDHGEYLAAISAYGSVTRGKSWSVPNHAIITKMKFLDGCVEED